MSAKKYIASVAVLFSTLAATAFGHHNGNLGSVGALTEEAQALYSAVYYARLSYRVKNVVYQFVNDVRGLDQCVETQPMAWHHHDDVGVPPACYSWLQRARSDFNAVAYYLYDAADQPAVYDAYLDTQQALNAIP